MASRGRVCRTGMFAARLLTNFGAVGVVVFLSVFTPAAAAAATYSISSGSTTPTSAAPGQTIAIKANFSMSVAGTVQTYFEIRNSSNTVMTSKWYYSQVFSAGQVRSYTWSLLVPSKYAAGTYRVNASIFKTDRSNLLKSVTGITSFRVTTTAPTPTPTPTPAPPPTTTGRQFYVDNISGSDSSSGTSSTAPWKSLSKVNNTTYQAGDAINFKRGSVWTGTLQVKNSGTSSSRITYRAYGTGTAPQIKNPGVTYGHAVDVTGNYNVVQDLLLTDAHETGLMIKASAGHNVVQRNEITRVGNGVTVSGQYNLLTGNYVHDLKMIVNDSTPYTDYGAVCFWLQAANNEVSYNRGINCRAPSNDFGYDGGFVEIWQNGDNSSIHHNYAQNTNGFFELGAGGGGSARNVKVAYNLINNTNGGVCFNQGAYNISVANFKFENNTYVATASNNSGYRVLDCTNDYSAVQMRNNIFYSNLQIANNGNFTHSNNLYYMVNMVNGSGVGYSLGTGERTGNPVFVNLAGGDYHLQLTSPAIDAGMDLGYTKDIENHPVPQAVSSLIADMGAFEFGPGR
jgi:hypothetical protein